jgi:quercetin dioxygenase-like cupin family protein
MRIMLIAATLAATVLTTGLPLDAQTPPPGIAGTPLFDNSSVRVVKFQFLPGAREMPHTHPFGVLVIMASPGDTELLKGTETVTRTRQIGDAEFTEPNERHAWANVGSSPLEMIVVQPKPDRVPGGTAPAMPRPANISSKDVLDATDVTVRRVEFEPGAREVEHTHPYDFLIVPVTTHPMQVSVNGKAETKSYPAGSALYIARGTPHWVGNPSQEKAALLGVVVK